MSKCITAHTKITIAYNVKYGYWMPNIFSPNVKILQLNQEQKRIINVKPNGHSLLKGVVGSGKTTIAVTRLLFLLHNYCFDVDDRIMLVTYNKTLVNYFKYLYSKVEEESQIGYQSLFKLLMRR